MSDVYYVIEGSDVYWSGRSMHDFRSWSLDAVRFERPQDGERVLHWILPEEYRRTCRVTEHMDMEPPKPSPDSATPVQHKSGRKEVYAFMNLPYHVRVERAKRIGVFEEADCELDDSQQMLAWVKRAKAAGIVSDLMPTEAATTGKGEK